MEYKKNPHLELKRKSTLFFLSGLLLSQCLIFYSFSYQSVYAVKKQLSDDGNYIEEEILFEVFKASPTPKLPKPIIKDIVINPNAMETITKIEATEKPSLDEILERFNTVIPPIQTNTSFEESFDFSVTAAFPGGEEALIRFFENNLNYPDEALKYEVEGVVYVRFVVNKKGEIEHIQIYNKHKIIGFGLEDEAIRVANQMPKWQPAIQNGRPSPSVLVMPIRFTIRK